SKDDAFKRVRTICLPNKLTISTGGGPHEAPRHLPKPTATKIFSLRSRTNLSYERLAAARGGAKKPRRHRFHAEPGFGTRRDRARANHAHVQRRRPELASNSAHHSEVRGRPRPHGTYRDIYARRGHDYREQCVLQEHGDQRPHVLYLSSTPERLDHQRGERP